MAVLLIVVVVVVAAAASVAAAALYRSAGFALALLVVLGLLGVDEDHLEQEIKRVLFAILVVEPVNLVQDDAVWFSIASVDSLKCVIFFSLKHYCSMLHTFISMAARTLFRRTSADRSSLALISITL